MSDCWKCILLSLTLGMKVWLDTPYVLLSIEPIKNEFKPQAQDNIARHFSSKNTCYRQWEAYFVRKMRNGPLL